MNPKPQIKGLWVPLVTPFYNGVFDGESMIRLINETEPSVDGFMPCLSSGEGWGMDDSLWEEILQTVTNHANKPVAAGVLKNSIANISDLSLIAKKHGCVAVVVGIQGVTDEEQKKFCHEVSEKSALPIILYNTENCNISNTQTLIEISSIENIIALKDSSQNQAFFTDAIRAQEKGGISILQGMENQLLNSVGCNGYVLSLANVDPELCKKMLTSPSAELQDEVMLQWDTLGLASPTWYAGLKLALMSRGVIRSAELIK
jgi:4-hydroxy-tetrahydrodipicolinate synthase